MKYTILTLGNPEREVTRQAIRKAMRKHEEVFVECIDGKTERLNEAIAHWGFDINMGPIGWRPGEGGVWYSNINAWAKCVELDEPLLVFEDDAIIQRDFRTVMDRKMPDPDTFDFASFYSPYTSQHSVPLFTWETAAFNQEHGNVCMLYTPHGAQKMLDLLQANGLAWPVDIWIFKQAMDGNLNGLVPTKASKKVVSVDLDVPTNIHNDERIKVYKP